MPLIENVEQYTLSDLRWLAAQDVTPEARELLQAEIKRRETSRRGGEMNNTRRWLFAILPDGQSTTIHLDAGGNERDYVPPWTGSLYAAHEEAAMRVGLWEDRTGQMAQCIEPVSLGKEEEER